MRPLAASAAAALLLAAAGSAFAETLKVPSVEYPDIQTAVNMALDGDTILVSKGTYAEDVNITSKSNLRIKGKGNPLLTPTGVAFTIQTTSVVEISGFRVSGGAGAVAGSTRRRWHRTCIPPRGRLPTKGDNELDEPENRRSRDRRHGGGGGLHSLVERDRN